MSITHIRKPIPLAEDVIAPAEPHWLDAHPWSEVKPYALASFVCLLLGLIIAKFAWSRAWLRHPSRIFWIAGLSLMLYSVILLLERPLATILCFGLLGICVPAFLVGATIYIFRGPLSASKHCEDGIGLEQGSRFRSEADKQEKEVLSPLLRRSLDEVDTS